MQQDLWQLRKQIIEFLIDKEVKQLTEENNGYDEERDNLPIEQRKSRIIFSNANFARLVVNDLSSTRSGRGLLKKYKQSDVREMIEGYRLPKNQEKLREISTILFAKSPQYKRLLEHFSDMPLFSHILTPMNDLKNVNKAKANKQYTQLAELLKMMNIRHEMRKVLKIAFREDTFFGYVHKEKRSFYIQHIDASICMISSTEDGVYNYSIDMSYFKSDETKLVSYASEIQEKYVAWKALKNKNPQLSDWVELDSKNTICIKINQEMLESFPPFAGSFDAIFDIEGFKQLRKDKEELGNYMILTQELPIRKDSQDNNDFMIDEDTMRFFHSQAVGAVPDNVGVITSPMKIEPVKFEKDRADNDGVGKSTRDFWEGSGTSQMLFNADKSTSEGLKASIKTDEEIIFGVLTQIERWINRYFKFQFADLYYGVKMLPVTYFNQEVTYKMYLELATYGAPTKLMMVATAGLEPIEVINMAYLENEILNLNEEFIPLQSAHTMPNEEGVDPNATGGRPKTKKPSDETTRAKDKPSASS